MNVEAPIWTANTVMQRPTSSSATGRDASPRASSGGSRRSSSESTDSGNIKYGDSGRVALKGHNNNNNNNNNTCFEDQASPFTSDDEKKELATLSITDIIKIQNDLHGMTLDMANLDQPFKGLDNIAAQKVSAAGANSESQATTNNNTSSYYDATSAISRLNDWISTLPPAETAAYQQAQQQCPYQLSDERKMAFVEYEDGNIASAARKLVKYWSERLDAFGPERAFLPMTLAGGMQDEVMDWVQRPIWQLLPVTDSAGRSIFFTQTSLRDFSQYTTEQELRSFMYLLETLMEDDTRRRKGFIILYDGRDLQRKHFSRALSSKLASLVENIYPIDCKAIHNCHPSKVFNFVVMPIMKALITKEQRLRVKSHVGTIESVVRDLEGYCLSKELIPATLGGDLVPDASKWVLERIQLENSRLALRLSSMTPSGGIAGVAPVQDLSTMYTPAPTKRRRSDDDGGQHHQQQYQQGPPFAVPSMFFFQPQSGSVQQKVQFPGVQQPFQLPIQLAQLSGMSQQQQLPVQFNVGAPAPSMASPSVSSVSSKSSKKKAGKSGRRRGPPRGKYVDPRMTMAVKAKMANPNLPLQDALETGGFVFVKDPNSNDMIDLDGTSLVQRKNNLCRRIRLKKEEQITPPPAPIDTVASTNNVAAASQFSMPMPPLPSTNFQGTSFATAMAPQMQMGSTTGVGMPNNMGGVVNLQDFNLPATPSNNNNNNNMNQNGNFY